MTERRSDAQASLWRVLEKERVTDTPTETFELVDAAMALLKAGMKHDQVGRSISLPLQGHVRPEVRVNQLLTINWLYNLRHPEMRQVAIENGASFHSLLESADYVRRGKVGHTREARHDELLCGWLRNYVAQHGTWPKVDTIRRVVGLAGTSRLPGDEPGQESLL